MSYTQICDTFTIVVKGVVFFYLSYPTTVFKEGWAFRASKFLNKKNVFEQKFTANDKKASFASSTYRVFEIFVIRFFCHSVFFSLGPFCQYPLLSLAFLSFAFFHFDLLVFALIVFRQFVIKSQCRKKWMTKRLKQKGERKISQNAINNLPPSTYRSETKYCLRTFCHFLLLSFALFLSFSFRFATLSYHVKTKPIKNEYLFGRMTIMDENKIYIATNVS